jgi:hypothetical protein
MINNKSFLYLLFLWFLYKRDGIIVNALFEKQQTTSSSSTTPSSSGVLISGYGDHRWVYEPSFLPVPQNASIEHAHGIVIIEEEKGSNNNFTIIITYKDNVDDTKCLLKWTDDIAKEGIFVGPSTSNKLCKGIPHGLIGAAEIKAGDDGDNTDHYKIVLYHANNEKVLHKTTTDGDILWSVEGDITEGDGHYNKYNRENPSYRPTWFASQPNSPYIHLADGYGSSKIYVLNKYHGNYTGYSFGGIGTQHGKFQTCHSITYDDRYNQMVVCDRENHRLEYYNVDPYDPSVFDYSHTTSFYPLLQRPCNIRIRKDNGYAIVPFLEGSVGILNEKNDLVSLINITDTLGRYGFLHPHDAHFVPGTEDDFIVVFWNPGRIGYFRRVSSDYASAVL